MSELGIFIDESGTFEKSNSLNNNYRFIYSFSLIENFTVRENISFLEIYFDKILLIGKICLTYLNEIFKISRILNS